MLEFDEALPQDFTFIGQWGVTADRELRDIYWMRSRHYDAQLGRFLSFDPLGKYAFTKYNYYISWVCSSSYTRSDWLIVGHYSPVMPTGPNCGLGKTTQKAKIYNNYT